MTDPKWGDLIRIPSGGFNDLPDTPHPYYVAAKDGIFVRRRLSTGHGVAKINLMPDNWPKMGTSTGSFVFDAKPIPAQLMGQIVDFFTRVYEKQKTEAAILLTLHNETKEWGVFIPTQLVSHGGVNYVYDPTHIRGNRTVAGSIHSHADFSPFHSGTDTGDAADFDGLHCTVGFVNTTPKIVAMTSMNKQNMHYAEDQFPFLFDWEGVGQFQCPEWWFQYVGLNGEKPVGFNLYKKFEKPTTIKQESKVYKPTAIQPYQYKPHTTWKPSEYRSSDQQKARELQHDWGLAGYGGYQPLNESKKFNAKQAAHNGVKWLPTGQLGMDDLYWEDGLPNDIVSDIVSSNVVTDDEFDWAISHPSEAGDLKFWIEKFLTKVVDAADVLIKMGVHVAVTLEDEKGESFTIMEPEKEQVNVVR